MKALFVATPDRKLTGQGFQFDCAIGKGGMVPEADKAEGDGGSPIGSWTMKRVFWRPDRVKRPWTQLPAVPLRPNDGWCDAAGDPMYNRPVTRDYPASHETLWRDDHVYDLIVELSYNQNPAIPGKGSAIFMHVAKPDYTDTEGCIALAIEDLKAVLEVSGPGSVLEIAV
ncbi:L,D-transpeptidase family protein [Henriciella sp. AS95]|uniref:L,D-transpeptidase family protein n=1 Tax=Henriciella sp. AS95 TaxID=3135782 RepID=UPI003179240F